MDGGSVSLFVGFNKGAKMKDVGYHEFEADHPSPLTPRVARNRVVECLDLLHCDEVHKMGDNVSYGLTYENLIGALTDAKRALVAWEYRDKFAWWVRLIKDGVMQKPTAEFMLMVVMECEKDQI